MTAAPEKAAPIPADVLALAKSVSSTWNGQGLSVRIARAILADREARPSLPDSREERIKAGAAEDERDRIYAFLRVYHPLAAEPLRLEGAMFPRERARARQGGNNG